MSRASEAGKPCGDTGSTRASHRGVVRPRRTETVETVNTARTCSSRWYDGQVVRGKSLCNRFMGIRDTGVAVLFDGDDTLWEMQRYYEDAKHAWAALLRDFDLGGSEDIPRLDSLDASRVVIRGFTFDRFLESLLIYTAQLLGAHKQEWTIELEGRLRDVAAIAKRPPRLFRDTLTVLERLRSKARLFLVTAGEPGAQRWKVDWLGLTPYFEAIHIVPRKDCETLRRFAEKYHLVPSNSWKVGNSPRTDILPAIEAGFNAVLISNDTWAYDQAIIPRTERRFYRVSSLSEAAEIIMSESGGKANG